MADHFARPLRLTRQEALAVYVRATELAATPGMPGAPALAAALAKLRDALGAETLGEAAVVAAAERGAPPPHLEAVRAASEEHRAAPASRTRPRARASSTERVVEPEEVFASAGHWYVAAWDVDLDDERLLRVDRIAAVDPTGERFEPRGLEGAGRPLYTPSGGDVDVRVRLRPAARWVAEYYVATDPVERGDGSLEVTLPTGTGSMARAAAPAAWEPTPRSWSPPACATRCSQEARGDPRPVPPGRLNCLIPGSCGPGPPVAQADQPLRRCFRVR